jgi:hypothetical protein
MMRPVLQNHKWVGWLDGLLDEKSHGASCANPGRSGSASIERKIALYLPTCQCPCQWSDSGLDSRIPKRISY